MACVAGAHPVVSGSSQLELVCVPAAKVRNLGHPPALPSPLTWLEEDDFFLSVLESFLPSVLQSFFSLGKEAPSKLGFDLGKENSEGGGVFFKDC